jgi:hypothetical protein
MFLLEDLDEFIHAWRNILITNYIWWIIYIGALAGLACIDEGFVTLFVIWYFDDFWLFIVLDMLWLRSTSDILLLIFMCLHVCLNFDHIHIFLGLNKLQDLWLFFVIAIKFCYKKEVILTDMSTSIANKHV